MNEGMPAMVDHNDTGSVPDAGRPKRPAPTIDLTPTGSSERPLSSEAILASGAEPVPEPTAEPVSDAGDTGDTAPSDMPPFDATASNDEPPAAAQPKPSLLMPAVAGAVTGAVVAGLAWFALGPLSGGDKPDTDALAQRVAQLEARPVVTPDAAIGSRVDALERSLATLRSDVAAAKTQSERTAADIAQLKSAPRSAAPVAVDLGPVNDRLSQIERATGDLKTAAAQQNARPVDDAALRRVVAASLLDTAVRQGEPYAAALAAVKPLAGDAGRLQPLEVFAGTGVPSAAAMSRDLLPMLPKLEPAPADTPVSGGFLDRLQAGASRLVRVERTDAVGGTGRSPVAARAGAAARVNDIATAKRELLTLPASDRTAVQPWLDRAEARDAALAASRQFAAEAMTALAKPAP